jgi:hypothetical protein
MTNRRLLLVAVSAFALVVPAYSIAQSPAQAASSTNALAVAKTLEVKGRAPKTGYDRALFPHWKDTDGNGCDSRKDILKRDFATVTLASDGCKVTGGTFTDPYTGLSYTFTSTPSIVEIDHAVSLSDAWQKGAQKWSADKRKKFANDWLNLVAVYRTVNRSKSDADTATWLPPLKSYRCKFVARQVAVKKKYGLWVTKAEKDAMIRELSKPACASTKLPSSTSRA